MLHGPALIGVFTIALVMVLTPGPNMLYLVSRSVTQGRRAGVISLTGVGAGFVVYLTATNLGLAALFAAVPTLYLAIRIVGACYLGWLAFQALRPGGRAVFEPASSGDAQGSEGDSARRLFAMGFLTNVLNPKVAVMYVSLIPQFERPHAGHLVLQGFTLGGIQIGVSLAVNLGIVLAAGAIAGFLAQRPRWVRTQRYVMGTVLGALALRLLSEHARPAAA